MPKFIVGVETGRDGTIHNAGAFHTFVIDGLNYRDTTCEKAVIVVASFAAAKKARKPIDWLVNTLADEAIKAGKIVTNPIYSPLTAEELAKQKEANERYNKRQSALYS